MKPTRKLECGCELFTTIHKEPDIIFCPKHKSAPDLYKACKAQLKWSQELGYPGSILAKEALAKAEKL